MNWKQFVFKSKKKNLKKQTKRPKKRKRNSFKSQKK